MPDPGLRALLRYFRVRPVDPSGLKAEWAAWTGEVLEAAAVERMRADLELPAEAPLHAGYYDLLDDTWKARFADWLEEIGWDGDARVYFPHDAPAWTLIWPETDPVRTETAWWLHFTDAPEVIGRAGFAYGVADPDRLALTRLNDVFGNTTRITPQGPGYIFAYPADDTLDLDRRAGACGRHAVVFRAPALRVHHLGDRETQAIAHGPDVHTSDIRPVLAHAAGWRIGGRQIKSLNHLPDVLPPG